VHVPCGHFPGFVITAMGVTPEFVRIGFEMRKFNLWNCSWFACMRMEIAEGKTFGWYFLHNSRRSLSTSSFVFSSRFSISAKSSVYNASIYEKSEAKLYICSSLHIGVCKKWGRDFSGDVLEPIF